MDPRISFDFLVGMFLSVFRTRLWRENLDALDQAALHDPRVFSSLDNMAPHVKVFSGAGLPTTQVGIGSTPPAMRSFFAFDAGYRGGITVAGGDVNGDGHADIVVGTQADSPPHVKVFSGAGGAELHSFYALNPGYTGGISVAAGDINGDGRADIVVGASRGPTSQVRVFSGDNLIADYSAFTAAHLGARVGTQDIDGDGKREVIVVSGPSSPPRMRILNGLTGAVRRESPAMPGFYHGPTSILDLVDFVVGRICDQLGVPHQLCKRWSEP